MPYYQPNPDRSMPPNRPLPYAAFWLLLIACLGAGCSQPVVPSDAAHGYVTVDAKVPAGSRFIAYANDVWARPLNIPVVPNEWHEYRFPVPSTVTSFRLDPSELPGVSAEIRHVRFEMPGQPKRSLALEDLPRWLHYHCAVVYDPTAKIATVKSDGPDMYIMSTVDVASMRPE